MSRKRKSQTRQDASARVATAPGEPSGRPAVSNSARPLYDRAAGLIEGQQISEAMNLLRGQSHSDLWLRNLLAVCLLRSNRPQEAMDLLRPGVWASNGLSLRNDVPVEFIANFATGQLLQGRVNAAVNALDSLRRDDHPAVQKLRAAIAQWMNGLSFWGRWRVRLGIDPTEAIPLGFTPGEIPPEQGLSDPE